MQRGWFHGRSFQCPASRHTILSPTSSSVLLILPIIFSSFSSLLLRLGRKSWALGSTVLLDAFRDSIVFVLLWVSMHCATAKKGGAGVLAWCRGCLNVDFVQRVSYFGFHLWPCERLFFPLLLSLFFFLHVSLSLS